MGFEEINPRLTRSRPLARPPAFPSMSQLPKLAPFLDFARNDKRRVNASTFPFVILVSSEVRNGRRISKERIGDALGAVAGGAFRGRTPRLELAFRGGTDE